MASWQGLNAPLHSRYSQPYELRIVDVEGESFSLIIELDSYSKNCKHHTTTQVTIPQIFSQNLDYVCGDSMPPSHINSFTTYRSLISEN